MLGAATIPNFKANLRGQAIEPQDQDYDETRALYNAMIDKMRGSRRILRSS